MKLNIHPNLAKRPLRARESMVDKLALYIPRGISANTDIPTGGRVRIIKFVTKKGKDLSFVEVRTPDGKDHLIMFKDLAFVK